MQTTIRLQIGEIIKNFNSLNNERYLNKISKASDLFFKYLKKKNKIIFLGNGGSASDAEHLSESYLDDI